MNPNYLCTEESLTDSHPEAEANLNPVEAEAGLDPVEACVNSSDSEWTEVWENHKEEQFCYYYNWFSQWWVSNHVNSEITSTKVDQTQNLENNSVSEIMCLEELTLEPEMDDTSSVTSIKEQKDKTSIEKTQEYLTDLGFSTSIDKPSSSVLDCKLETKKKKKRPKKNRVRPGPVPNTPDGVRLVI